MGVLRQNALLIIGTSICGIFLGLFGASALARSIGLPPSLARPFGVRFFSAPLAIQSAEALQVSTAMAAAYSVASGLMGATIGLPWLTKICRVHDASRLGICIGCASHGQGTAMLASANPEAAAFSSTSFVLTGVLGSLLVHVSYIQDGIFGITG